MRAAKWFREASAPVDRVLLVDEPLIGLFVVRIIKLLLVRTVECRRVDGDFDALAEVREERSASTDSVDIECTVHGLWRRRVEGADGTLVVAAGDALVVDREYVLPPTLAHFVGVLGKQDPVPVEPEALKNIQKF